MSRGPCARIEPSTCAEALVEPASATSAAAAMPSSGDLREFFSQLHVRRESSGKIVIEAPSEAASTLGPCSREWPHCSNPSQDQGFDSVGHRYPARCVFG